MKGEKDVEDYKPNSHKSKEGQKDSRNERKKLEKVVDGTAKVKKKGKTSKFAEMFIAEDLSSVKSYIVSDVLIPAAKKLFVDAIKDAVDMFVYGRTDRGKRSSGFRADYVSYNRYSDRKYDDHPGNDVRRNSYSYDDVILETRGEAEEVLDTMNAVIDEYGMVSVMDLYDLVGITGQYTDNNYGWKNLRNAEPVRVRDGYMLKMPRAVPLK